MTGGHIWPMVTLGKILSGKKPVPPAAGRRERRRQETSEKLFMAAMELFSRKGFAQTKVEDITQAADVGKGTFFNYFPSKEHVLGYLVSKQQGTVERHLVLAREATMESEEVLISLGRSLIGFPGKSPPMARSIILAFLGNIEVREYIVRQMSLGRKSIAEIMRLGQERGELHDGISPAELARVFQHALFGTVLMWALDPESSLEKQFGNTMRIFFSGLNAPSKPPRSGRCKVLPRGAKVERKGR
jgi:AcrR family transcriptional regulator